MDLYMMNCELLATCSALGYLEGDTYHREPDCLGESAAAGIEGNGTGFYSHVLQKLKLKIQKL